MSTFLEEETWLDHFEEWEIQTWSQDSFSKGRNACTLSLGLVDKIVSRGVSPDFGINTTLSTGMTQRATAEGMTRNEFME